MKKLFLALALLVPTATYANPECRPVIEAFYNAVTAEGYAVDGEPKQIGPATWIVEFKTKDSSLRKAMIISLESNLEEGLDERVKVTGKGTCLLGGQVFNYVQLAADFGVQADNSAPSTGSSQTRSQPK